MSLEEVVKGALQGVQGIGQLEKQFKEHIKKNLKVYFQGHFENDPIMDSNWNVFRIILRST